MVDRKRPPILVFIIPLMAGLAGFYRVTQSPSFELYRTVDVVLLSGRNACLGAEQYGLVGRTRAWSIKFYGSLRGNQRGSSSAC